MQAAMATLWGGCRGGGRPRRHPETKALHKHPPRVRVARAQSIRGPSKNGNPLAFRPARGMLNTEGSTHAVLSRATQKRADYRACVLR